MNPPQRARSRGKYMTERGKGSSRPMPGINFTPWLPLFAQVLKNSRKTDRREGNREQEGTMKQRNEKEKVM